MKLTYTCSHCKQKAKLPSNALTRTELHQEHGNIIQVKCNNCPNLNKLNLLDIRASNTDFYTYLTPIVGLIGLVLGGIFALVMWKIFYFTPRIVLSILFVFVAFPLGISYQVTNAEQAKVSRFNRSR